MRGQRGKWLAALIALTFLMTNVLLAPPVQAAADEMIIKGRLSDERGDPVVLQTVYLDFFDDEGEFLTGPTTNTDWNGRYSFGPISITSFKRYRLGTYNPAEEGRSYWYDVCSPGTLVKDINITIYGTTVINVINDEDGTAVPPGVPVWITYVGPHPLDITWPWDAPSYGGTPHHLTNSEGRIFLYMIYGASDIACPAGRLVTGGIDQTYNMVDQNGIDHTGELRYEMGTQMGADASTRPGETRYVDFRVQGLGRVIAAARDAVTAAPIPEILWEVSSDSGFYKYWQTSADSSTLSVYGYGNEDMIITANAAPDPGGNCPGYQQPASATVKVKRWGTETVELRLQPNSTGTISGKVLGPDGNGLPEAGVSLIWVEGEWGEVTVKELTADSSGNYIFQDVIPSTDRSYYLIRATKAGYGKAEFYISSLSSGENMHVDDLAIGYDTADPCWSSGDKLKAMIGWTAVRLAWPEAWDDTGIKGYRVYRDVALLADISATAYTAGDLETDTDYNFSVIAYDAAGKSSKEPLAVSVTTLPVYNPEEKVIRASVTSEGIEGNEYSGNPAVSADGRFIVFESEADNLHEPDSNAWSSDIFLFDRDTGQLKCISTTPAGTTGNDASCRPAISGDGRYIVFVSYADDLASP